jgi:hypothetical protein
MRTGRTFLARPIGLRALALVALLGCSAQAIAQTAAQVLSVAERKAAFDEALRHRQAGNHRDALQAFAKAANAGDRRAAAWAAIAHEEGAGTVGPADGLATVAAQWHIMAATGGLFRSIPAHLEWLGNGAIRYHVKPDHHRVTIRADGSWTRELLRERMGFKDGAQTPESEDALEYAIHEDADGNVTVADWRGNWWSLDAATAEDRLTRDANSGDLTFIDDLKRTVTLRQNGRRTVKLEIQDAHRWEMDLGGRLVGIYNTKGEASSQYQHDYRGTADPILTRYIGVGHALWGMTLLDSGKQRWTLLNSDNPSKPVHMDVGISMNRANSLVFEDPIRRRIDTGDGTVVEEIRRQDPNGVSVIEKKVGDRQKKTAYTLFTHQRGGATFKQELKSGAGLFVRGGDGSDYRFAPWWETDASGQRKPGKSWAGDIFIDDNGTLIKRGFVSDLDPSRPGLVRARQDAQGKPITDDITYIYTSGESEQWFAHGGMIRRDLDGDVLWTVTPAGETTRYYYAGEGKDRHISGIREGANPRWAWVGHFASRSPSNTNLATANFVEVTVNRKSGDTLWEDKQRKTRTTWRVDGSRQFVAGDDKSQRIIDVDAKGRTTRFLSPTNREFRLHYAEDGRLARVDHADGQDYSIVDAAYKAPAELPLSAKQVLRGTGLEFFGWGEERTVSFLDPEGKRVNFRGDATVEEHAGEANAPLVRVVLRGDLPVSTNGGDGLSFWGTSAEKIHGVSGEGWTRSVVYSNRSGTRFQRFASGATSEFDADGRLVAHTAGPRREYKLVYAEAKSLKLDSATVPGRRLSRAELPADVLDFQLTRDRVLVITLKSGFEIHDIQNGKRSSIGQDGTLLKYDDLDRLSFQQDLDGGNTYLFYDGGGTTPVQRGEVGGIKAKLADKGTLSVLLEQGHLQAVERTVQTRQGTIEKKQIVRRDGNWWIDEDRYRFASAWVSEAPRRVFLASNNGRFIRAIHEDGTETLFSVDDRYETRSRVVKSALGEVAAVKHADQTVTHFERDDTGSIHMITQGPDLLVRDKKAAQETYKPSTSDTSFRVRLSVNGGGEQSWTGRDGTVRTVKADGTILLEAPNGRKSLYSPDRSVRHQFPGRIGMYLAEVSQFPNGDLEWAFSNGSVGRHVAHGTVSELLTRDRTPDIDRQGRAQRTREYVSVNPAGDLAFLRPESRVLRVNHAAGTNTEFARAGSAGWRDPYTGEVFADSPREIQQRLWAMGMPAPGLSNRHHILQRTENAATDRLTLGLFDLDKPAVASTSPRRPVSLLVRQDLERRLNEVALTAEGKAQMTYASGAQR